MLEKYPKDVKIVVKHFPLANHKFARKAAIAALAADKQGKFWEFNDRLFENFGNLNDDRVRKIAKELGLDQEKFYRYMKDPTIWKLVARDINDGRKAGVNSVPRLFVNGKLLKLRSLQGLSQMIEAELNRKSGR